MTKDLIGDVWRSEAGAMVNLEWPFENAIIPAMREVIAEVNYE